MRKKDLQILMLLAALSIGNKAMGCNLSSEEWRDSVGHPAPALVAQAADKLWDTMEATKVARTQWNLTMTSQQIFQEVLQDMGQKLRRLATPWIIPRIFFAPWTILQILSEPVQRERSEDVARALMWECRSEMMLAAVNFKKTVKEHVKGRYWFGDLAEDDNYDEWVPAQRWQVQIPCPILSQTDENYQREMYAIPSATLVFVNAWSGWASDSE